MEQLFGALIDRKQHIRKHREFSISISELPGRYPSVRFWENCAATLTDSKWLFGDFAKIRTRQGVEYRRAV